MFRILILVLCASIALAAVACAPVAPSTPTPAAETVETSGAQTAITATEVITYVPATLPTATQPGSCFTNAIGLGRADAWRCTTEDSEIHDPCFQVDDKPTVVCDADPLTGAEGFVLALTEPLPAPDPGTPSEAWLVKLESGVACGLLTGTIPGGDDWTAPYGCQDQSYLTDEFRTEDPVWLAEQVTVAVGDTGFTTQTAVLAPIATVWR